MNNERVLLPHDDKRIPKIVHIQRSSAEKARFPDDRTE